MAFSKTITKIGGVFVIVLGICLFLAVLFRPNLKGEIEKQLATQMGWNVKIQSQSAHLFPPSLSLHNVRIEGDISCQIPQVQLDFSLLSAFQKNKQITKVILKKPICAVPPNSSLQNPAELQNLFKKITFRFPVEIQDGTFSYPAFQDISLQKLNLVLTSSFNFSTAEGTFIFHDKPFQTRLRLAPLQQGLVWQLDGKAAHNADVFFNFSFKFMSNKTQGFFNFALSDAAAFFHFDETLSPIASSDKIEGTISIDFAPRNRNFPLFIVRLADKGNQTALTGNLSWQYNPKNTNQNSLSGKIVVKELNGNLKTTALSYLTWQKLDILKYFNNLDLELLIQKLPLNDAILKNVSVKAQGGGTQLFFSDGKADFAQEGKMSFDGFLENRAQTPLLKIRFDGKTGNIRPFLALTPLPVQEVPTTLLKRASFNGTLQITPQNISLDMPQFNIDDVKLAGRLNRQKDGKALSLKTTIQNLNLDAYVNSQRVEGPQISFEQLPSQIAQWITSHWLQTASILDVDMTATNSLYLNLPFDSFSFVGKLQKDSWHIQNLKIVNMAGLNVDGLGEIRLLPQNKLEIPAEFTLKLSSQQLPIFLQRARLSSEKPKEILFDGSLSGQNNILTAVGIWQEDTEPYEKIEKQFNY